MPHLLFGEAYLPFRQIPLRQDFALLDRWLVERIDSERVAGEDRLEHRVHEEFAERAFVETLQMDAPGRAGVAREGIRRGATLGGDEVADPLAAEIRLARALRELRIDQGPLPRHA